MGTIVKGNPAKVHPIENKDFLWGFLYIPSVKKDIIVTHSISLPTCSSCNLGSNSSSADSNIRVSVHLLSGFSSIAEFTDVLLVRNLKRGMQ